MATAGRPLKIEIVSPFLRARPVNIRGMLDALGLRLVEAPLPADVSGKIECDWAGDCVVTVNSGHSETRKRFTIAHEIAHYMLHTDMIGDGIVDDGLYRDSRLPDAIERQASRFAATLLMPPDLVREAWDEGHQSASGLAQEFGVSPAVAEIRMRELGCARWPRAMADLFA